ncbi:MAG: hypothetical protein GX620_01360 [Chloroflexi bacterium]|nr:hypothetical protein [Chloroflexota bacterium]
MSAPYRIQRLESVYRGQQATSFGTTEGFNSYLDRLLKMVPAEVISLYLVGSGLIPDDQPAALAFWTLVCLVGVVLLRVYGTADPAEDKPTDWLHVAISSVAFLLMVYSLGGPFAAYDLHVPYLGSLLVLAWTFFLPIFYKGPRA